MIRKMKHDVKQIAAKFEVAGQFLEAIPYGSGHINDTYASRFQVGAKVVRFIHQHINRTVFKEPEKLMENIGRVTAYARTRIIAAGGDPDRETLNLVPARDGRLFHVDPDGEYWRTYTFIEGARTFDLANDLANVYHASKAFGDFQKLLSTLPGKRLHETIPNFHHTRRRYENFLAALDQDPARRAASVAAEIDFVREREADTGVIVDLIAGGGLPERVTHNDTKLNNVLIDDRTGRGICVIDLDTIMPGSALYDFGDSVRIGASTAAEDERDLARVGVSLPMFDRLADGYLSSARDFLTAAEMDYLPFAAKLMTFECGVRFLTDHLDGDKYFRIHRENHNLDRCRTQFKMVEQMERKMSEMSGIIAKYR